MTHLTCRLRSRFGLEDEKNGNILWEGEREARNSVAFCLSSVRPSAEVVGGIPLQGERATHSARAGALSYRRRHHHSRRGVDELAVVRSANFDLRVVSRGPLLLGSSGRACACPIRLPPSFTVAVFVPAHAFKRTCNPQSTPNFPLSPYPVQG